MGRLRDKINRFRDDLSRTKYPDSGVTPLSPAEVRDALLAINGSDVSISVRGSSRSDAATLLAEWQVWEPAWGSVRSRKQLERKFHVWMRLDPVKCEVQSIDEQWKVMWVGDPPTFAVSREHGRGQIFEVSWESEFQRGSDGRRHKVETFRFDTRLMKKPLRDAVLGAGWIWRGLGKNEW
ncbi:hypothetical protein ABZ442_19055 [Streptomyces triculaminicus]|uniref:hypothetical protein n=1 Tax=Streptomyces triculaminicus TaxID=2816232 RepID=UPI0033E54097